MDGSPALDDIDRALLEVLAVDGRCSVNELAGRVGIGRATAYARLARLRGSGVIRGFTVRTDPRALGLAISALLLVRVDQRDWREVAADLRQLPGVEWLGATAGEFDFAVLVRVADVDELRDAVLERTVAIPGVRSSETVLILEDHWGG
jgi:DNA-binding Lrp family transcriptional regulator